MEWQESLANIKNTIIENEEVFDAVRRGYSELENASNNEILDYFDSSSTDELRGHVSNIKGILFEQEVQDKLSQAQIDSEIFESTNHPVSDMIVENEEFQLKATDNEYYVSETLSESPNVAIITTSEVANSMDSEDVIDSGISDTVLEEIVVEVISPVPTPTNILLFGGIGLLFGLPF